ncbi:MAG: indolepyruvate ferredoxin oxidoreductase [Chrysiogenales bacterium]|nr:MAG: indolepyruvate ferredoxin oxidoreductase [Chrysiogenales bacterium]
MLKTSIPVDPYNIIITGVGGQGNVMASRMLGNALVRKGYFVTIGETFGVSQRGGSVMSHMRISEKSPWSPQIPRGRADMVVALEPSEALRVIAAYGNGKVIVISNTRPIHPVGVIAGEASYPPIEELMGAICELAGEAIFIPATDEALRMGNPILVNVIMLGALSAFRTLPFDVKNFREIVSETMPANRLEMNVLAFEKGKDLARAKMAGVD